MANEHRYGRTLAGTTCGAATMALLTVLGGFFFAWRKRSFIEDDPVPHCNLQERLDQIANTPMVPGMTLELRAPAGASVKSQLGPAYSA